MTTEMLTPYDMTINNALFLRWQDIIFMVLWLSREILWSALSFGCLIFPIYRYLLEQTILNWTLYNHTQKNTLWDQGSNWVSGVCKASTLTTSPYPKCIHLYHSYFRFYMYCSYILKWIFVSFSHINGIICCCILTLHLFAIYLHAVYFIITISPLRLTCCTFIKLWAWKLDDQST